VAQSAPSTEIVIGRAIAAALLYCCNPPREGTQSQHILARVGLTETENTPLEHCRGTETILLVDDEDSLRTVIVDLLSHLGYRTISAASGPDALELAREYPGKIDLLLTDVVMHPLSGPDLAKTLMRSRPEMKVVFISGYANPSLAPDGELKPGTVLVHKPFSMKILSAKLREVLGNAASA
jgi:CheY-like chemotaxis protein